MTMCAWCAVTDCEAAALGIMNTCTVEPPKPLGGVNPVKVANQAWEAAAIEKCRNDPKVAELGLCPVCMCATPCLCDRAVVIEKMRRYYNAYTKFWRGRTYTNKRPGYLSLGYTDSADELVDSLYRIAHGQSDVFIEGMLSGTLKVGD